MRDIKKMQVIEEDHKHLQDLMILVDQRNIERFDSIIKRMDSIDNLIKVFTEHILRNDYDIQSLMKDFHTLEKRVVDIEDKLK